MILMIKTLIATSKVVGVGLGQLESTNVVEVQKLQHLLGVGIDLNDVLLQGGNGGHVVVTTLTLLLLQLNGDTTHLGVTQAAHQVGNITEDGKSKLIPCCTERNYWELTRQSCCGGAWWE